MQVRKENEFVDYYELLGIQPDADTHEIRAAFLAKAQLHHPDVGGSATQMQLLNAAYTTLKSATGKAAYDTVHSLQSDSKEPPKYRYDGGKHAKDIDDMTDDEIDEFLDTMFKEFRNGIPAKRSTVKDRLKKMFEI